MSDRELEAELRGKTFRVYAYMLMRGKPSYGVREIQRALGFSSPSVAAYHLTWRGPTSELDRDLVLEAQRGEEGHVEPVLGVPLRRCSHRILLSASSQGFERSA